MSKKKGNGGGGGGGGGGAAGEPPPGRLVFDRRLSTYGGEKGQLRYPSHALPLSQDAGCIIVSDQWNRRLQRR